MLSNIIIAITWLFGGSFLIFFLTARYQLRLKRKQLYELSLRKEDQIPVQYSRASESKWRYENAFTRPVEMYVTDDFILFAPSDRLIPSILADSRLPMLFTYHPKNIKGKTTIHNVWIPENFSHVSDTSFTMSHRLRPSMHKELSYVDIQLLRNEDTFIMQKVKRFAMSQS